MPQIIQKGNELIRINPTNRNELQYSQNGGTNWSRRFQANSNTGNFIDLLDWGSEILAVTKDGEEIYYSKNFGTNWSRRFIKNSNTGSFHNLNSSGLELLATTEKGLFYSKNNGSNWSRK